MADYKHTGFDPVYGYVEEIQFKPLSQQCEVKFNKKLGAEAELKLEEVLASQEQVEQQNLTVPECKCLRH